MSATLLGRSMRIMGGIALFLLGVGLATTNTYAMVDGPPDADQTPIKAGYVVVTPSPDNSNGNKEGLVVFETFGERRGNDTPQAGVLSSSLSTHFLLYVNMSGRLSRNMGVAIANPNSDATNQANLKMTLRYEDENGTPVSAAKEFRVLGKQQVAWMVTELFPDQASVPRDIVGTLDISSTTSTTAPAVLKPVPVAVTGLRFRGMNFSTLPATVLETPVPLLTIGTDDGGDIGGDGSVVLAHFVTGGGWATEIVLINAGEKDLNVRVDLFGQEGKPLAAQLNGETASSFLPISTNPPITSDGVYVNMIPTIPPGGVYVLSPRDKSGDSGL